MLDDLPFKNIGFNYYPAIVNFTPRATIQSLGNYLQDNGSKLFRTWFMIHQCRTLQTIGGVPTLVWNESVFDQFEMVLEELGQRDIKVVPSLANNPDYNTKQTLCHWADVLYGTSLETAPYTGFFDNSHCRDFFKEFIDEITSRYKDDDRIAWWELMNEGRYDKAGDANINTTSSANLAALGGTGGWTDVMSTYLKTKDPNHLVLFGGLEHTWQWINGDTVSNGTLYGTDYRITGALTNIDGIDYHNYPTQAGDGTQLQKYGQRLGYPNTITGNGYKAQIYDYNKAGKIDINKPVVCGEIGLPSEVIASNTHYPLYPRHNFFKEFFHDFFDTGGDVVFLWHATILIGGSYSVLLDATGNPTVNDNSNDTKIMSLVAQWNAKLAGKRIPLSAVEGITI